MDNIFEILIYLFIIVSFVSSFLKKRKKTAPQQQRQQVPIEEEEEIFEPETQMKTEKVEDYDILKELEQFFKVGEQGQPKPRVEHQQTPQPVRYEPKPRTVDEAWKTPTPSEHAYENTWEKRRKEIDARKREIEVRSSVKAAKFEQILSAKRSSKQFVQSELKNKFKQVESLKEFIIVSEILGKPKAYRR